MAIYYHRVLQRGYVVDVISREEEVKGEALRNWDTGYYHRVLQRGYVVDVISREEEVKGEIWVPPPPLERKRKRKKKFFTFFDIKKN